MAKLTREQRIAMGVGVFILILIIIITFFRNGTSW